jgi:hypothetical protein
VAKASPAALDVFTCFLTWPHLSGANAAEPSCATGWLEVRFAG